MTSFFHDLEEQLRTAAQDRTAGRGAPEEPPRRSRPRRWLAGGARAVPVAVAIAVALAVVVGALVLVGHRGGTPSLEPSSHAGVGQIMATTPQPQLKRELAYIGAAADRSMRAPACRMPFRPGSGVIHARPSTALLATLGVLRRPATAADHLMPATIGLDRGLTVYAGSARRVAVVGRTTYYLVAVRDNPAAQMPSGRCFDLQARALRDELPSIPADLRAPTLALQTALIARDRGLAGTPPADGVCEVTRQDNGGGWSCGDVLPQIRKGVPPTDDNGTYVGIAPDGVASVTLRVQAAGGHAGWGATMPVHDNLYLARGAGANPSGPGPSLTVLWRAPDGHVIKRFTEPGLQQLRATCRRHPSSCTPVQVSAGASSSSSATTATVTPAPQRGG